MNFNYKRLNDAFRHLQDGARLIAAAKNRYFKDEDPMDKTIEDENGQSSKITGLVEDVPHNTPLRFSAVASRSTPPEEIGSGGNFGVF